MIEQLYNALDITSLTYAQHSIMLLGELLLNVSLAAAAVGLAAVSFK